MKEQIKKGDWFKCIKDLRMKNDNKREYTLDKYYQSEINGCITNDSGLKQHQWPKNATPKVNTIFRKLFTLQDLEDGKCAIEVCLASEMTNVKKMFLSASGKNIDPRYIPCRYYYRGSRHDAQHWHGSSYVDLPTQYVGDFLVQIPKEINENELKEFSKEMAECYIPNIEHSITTPPEEFKIGNNYFFSNSKIDWLKGELLAIKANDERPYKVYLYDGSLKMFKFISKKIVVTSKEIAEMKGCNVEDLIIQY